MKMFKCELINEGIVVERFFKRGESAQVIKGSLKDFAGQKESGLLKNANLIVTRSNDYGFFQAGS